MAFGTLYDEPTSPFAPETVNDIDGLVLVGFNSFVKMLSINVFTDFPVAEIVLSDNFMLPTDV